MWIIQIALFPLWFTSSAVMALQVWFSLTLTILLSSLKLLMLFMQCYQCDSAIHGIEGCDDRFDLSLFCKSNPQTSSLKWNYPCFAVISNFKIHSSEHKGELINCPAEESRGCYIVESETFNAQSTKDTHTIIFNYSIIQCSKNKDIQRIIFSNTWREIDSSKRLHKSGRRVQIHLWHSQGWILCE